LLQKDKARGYVIEEGFFETNISTIAAPVHDDSGVVVAALGLTVPNLRIPEIEREQLIEKVKNSACLLSRSLNYSGVCA
jgi:DNA-binding IclR family transcriptional regulator